jgi:hypothetical protein
LTPPVTSQSPTAARPPEIGRARPPLDQNRRPTVIVGGELTLDALEIRHDPTSNVSEASLQLKSNCGCLLIDDFGRQRMSPTDLLNRWIIPLENRHDYLTLATGKKIQVPFEQLIIFSTNLQPTDLADEASSAGFPTRSKSAIPRAKSFRRSSRSSPRPALRIQPEVVDHLIENTISASAAPSAAANPATCYIKCETIASITACRSR